MSKDNMNILIYNLLYSVLQENGTDSRPKLVPIMHLQTTYYPPNYDINSLLGAIMSSGLVYMLRLFCVFVFAYCIIHLSYLNYVRNKCGQPTRQSSTFVNCLLCNGDFTGQQAS